MNDISITVDSREASSAKTIFKGLKKLLGEENVEVENLGQAIDYAIPSVTGEWHIIQRKRATEMMNKNAVLSDIAEMVMVEDAVPYLLIENTLSIIQKFSSWREQPIIGIVESVILPRKWGGFNVHVIPSPNQKWSVQWLVARARKLGRPYVKKPLQLTRTMSKEYSEKDKAIYFLTGLPDISWVLANRILDKYGSVMNALEHLEDWSNDIRGIGEMKSEGVKKVLFYQI